MVVPTREGCNDRPLGRHVSLAVTLASVAAAVALVGVAASASFGSTTRSTDNEFSTGKRIDGVKGKGKLLARPPKVVDDADRARPAGKGGTVKPAGGGGAKHVGQAAAARNSGTDFTLFRNQDVPTGGSGSVKGEPSVGNDRNGILFTGNKYATVSSDNGINFSWTDPKGFDDGNHGDCSLNDGFQFIVNADQFSASLVQHAGSTMFYLDTRLVTGWTSNGQVGWMWSAPQGGDYAFPQVRAASFDS